MKLGVNKFYEDIDLEKNPGETKNYLVKILKKSVILEKDSNLFPKKN